MVSYATGSGSKPASIAVGDVDGDGYRDIVVTNTLAHNVGVLLGNGDGTFGAQTSVFTGPFSYPKSIAMDDFDGDGHLDIVVVSGLNENVALVLLGIGDGDFPAQIISSVGIRVSSFVISDFDGDGHLDLAVVSTLSETNGRVLLGHGDGSFGPGLVFSTEYDGSPISVAINDLNGDGRADLVVANFERFNVGVLLGNGAGAFGTQTSFWTGAYSYPKSVVIEDFNGDGHLDLAVANYYAYNLGVLLGNGNGTFAAQRTFWTGYRSYPSSIVTDDFNGDGHLDLAIANYGMDNVGVLLGNGDGTFEAQTTFSTGLRSKPMCIALGDFNGDSQLDIAVTNSGSDQVGILLNTC